MKNLDALLLTLKMVLKEIYRRLKTVSPENFYFLSKKYFIGLDTNNGKFEFTVEPDDKAVSYSF